MTELWFQKLFINEAKPALKRHSGGGGDLGIGATDIATAEEMDAILANATVANTGDTYRYTGETTDKYTQGAYYVLIGEIKLQEKEADGNGEVAPDEGYDGLSKVTVNAPSSLKKLLDITKSLSSTFYNRNDVTDLTGVIEYNDTSNVTDTSGMFYRCYKLTEVPLFDTGNVTKMDSMFYECLKLSTVPLFDTGNVTSMRNLLYGCSNLTTVPLFDTSNVTDMYSMLGDCSKIQSAPLFNTRNATNMQSVFYECSSLTTVPALDIRNATRVEYIVNNCKVLTTCLLKNIKVNLQVGSGTSYGHLLTMDSLLSLLNETVYTTSSKTLTVGTANLAKFTGEYEYVKPTGVYLDLDDNEVTELTDGATKIPVTWCSSTDEGAMTVADYMMSKGWAIA